MKELFALPIIYLASGLFLYACLRNFLLAGLVVKSYKLPALKSRKANSSKDLNRYLKKEFKVVLKVLAFDAIFFSILVKLGVFT